MFHTIYIKQDNGCKRNTIFTQKMTNIHFMSILDSSLKLKPACGRQS